MIAVVAWSSWHAAVPVIALALVDVLALVGVVAFRRAEPVTRATTIGERDAAAPEEVPQ
ncbi:MAG TPA: hypothetical protein VEI83_16460 [Acidimicrobiales bacterium]|nr:hypothetical protein [Acidimicrobiales bacterium]